MKYTQAGNCPFCDSERGETIPWGMGPEGTRIFRDAHDNNHPENEPTGLKCPHCGKEI